MRTIKFKGQMVDTAQAHGDGAVWVCSNCLLQVDGKCYIGNNSTTKSISPSSFVYIEFAEVVNVRQYTGLKDKNGVEIYEGDVLELDGWKPFFLVVFDDVKGGFYLDCGDDHHLDMRYLYEGGKNISTIIGNVYDNPALMSKAND